jgi:hypothetical protein
LILYCDEDVGTKVPQALKTVGLHVLSAVSRRAISEPDIQWIARAGIKGWLALSCNKNILDVPEEKDSIILNNVGIVFLTSGDMHPKDKLLLVLKKWEWMETIDTAIKRPFAFFLSPSGQIKKML